jgi:hypothetical protein
MHEQGGLRVIAALPSQLELRPVEVVAFMGSKKVVALKRSQKVVALRRSQLGLKSMELVAFK